MMDRNYPPAPSYPDPLGSAVATASSQPATVWAYEQGVSSLNPSLNYGGGHSSHSEADLLGQTYTASQQLPVYTTTPHPSGLPGIFDNTTHSSNCNTKETSVMNFLSAIESRNTQTVSSGTTLLPQFREPTWQPAGMHSSSAPFDTGTLPTSGTFPSTSVYQHPNAFSSRNFVTTPSLTLQDTTFNATSNGLLTAHDPLLQIKTPQGTVPPTLTFDRLGNCALSTSIPPESSTYRSAQESAPHLLQPQFSLLPSSLGGGAQQIPQVYNSTQFTGSTASIERALQRECSVIKHHQRPSNTQSVQAQLTGSQHSLQNYLPSTNESDFQDAPRQSTCSPAGDATQVSSSGPQQKTSQVSVELAQWYASAVPSPGFPSVSTTKANQCSTEQPTRSTRTPNPQSVAPSVQTQSYSKIAQNQNSVIAGQAQIYSTAQLPSLLSVSQSQNYISTQSQNVPPVSHAQVFSAIEIEKLPSLYKTLSFAGQSEVTTSESQSLPYTSDQQVLTSVSNTFSGQTRDLSSSSLSGNYSSSHSQGMSTVSQPQISYSSQSQVLSVVSPSETFSSHIQNLSTASPPQNYISLHSQVQESSSPQSQFFLPVVQSTPFEATPNSPALQNNRSSSDTYIKRKSDPNLYQTSKQDDQFPMHNFQALQQQASLDSSPQRLTDGEINAQDTTYKVSKADNRYSQSVIRSNSRLADQIVGLTFQGSKEEETMVNSVTQISHITNTMNHDIKKAGSLLSTAQVNADSKELRQQESLMHKVHEVEVSEQQIHAVSSPSPLHTQPIRHSHQLCLPTSQVLLDSPCDLQMLQQSILQSGLGYTKSVPQVQHIMNSQQYLQVDGHMIQGNGRHSQEQLHSQHSEVLKVNLSEPSKPLQQHLTPKDHFGQPNHERKNQFVPLSSVCFPESELLNDERNILSNVDDIWAATAAACGVTPSEFAKSTANDEEIQSVENGDSPKSQLSTIDVRHMTPSFNSSPAVSGKPCSVNNIYLNGGHVTINLTAAPADQTKDRNLDQQHTEISAQGIPTRITTVEIERRQEQVSSQVKQQSSTRSESEGKNNVHMDGTLSIKDIDLISSSRTLNEEIPVSKTDYSMASDNADVPLQQISMQYPRNENGNNTEEKSQLLSEEDPQKQKDRGQNQIKDVNEADTNQKQLKRSGQCKRQNSRGIDASSPVPENCHETYQHQEKMREKIKEVEEKQPEVKTGFIGSFLDFLKSGPKQQFSASAIRVPNHVRRPVTPLIRAPCQFPISKAQIATATSSFDGFAENSVKNNYEDPKIMSEALPFFSFDKDNVRNNRDYQKSIHSPLSSSDTKTKSEIDKTYSQAITNTVAKKDASQMTVTVADAQVKTCEAQFEMERVLTEQLAKPQALVAIEGYTEDDHGDSDGEGIYRERDEFVVKIEDIEPLKAALKRGVEPPAIWKVQKALLQKFVPEVRDGQREFAATNSYLGYFGDARLKYKRVYVKFIENANKKEYVRVCSKKPTNSLVQSARVAHSEPSMSITKVPDPPVPKTTTTKVTSVKPKAKQPKTMAEPPPKKRKTWKEVSPSTPQPPSDEEDTEPPAPIVARFLNTRGMKETFRNYMELLVSLALDPDTMQALEKSNDELLLPHMRKIDGMLNDNRKKLLSKLHIERPFKAALECFPELTVITRDSKTKMGVNAVSRIKMNGKAYNKKTLKISKATTKLVQEFTIDPEKIPLCSLYHSLHHYKYHMFLRCKVEISSVQKKNADLGQEEILQQCMKNIKWIEDLFEKFGELLNHVQQKCC